MCGQDGKRFRTRDGGTTRLVDLLDEAKNRMAADTRARIAEGRTPLTEADVEHSSSVLGYSAVKYFDLKNSREKDYIFVYDQMLASDGDTAVYLIYSYARICSIEAKAAQVLGGNADATVQMALKQGKLRVSRDRPAEWQLALALIKFPDNLEHAVQELRPHHLCAYVYELAVAFAKFYSTHQLLVPSPANASQRMLDPQHGMAWLALLRAVKVALKDSLALLSTTDLLLLFPCLHAPTCTTSRRRSFSRAPAHAHGGGSPSSPAGSTPPCPGSARRSWPCSRPCSRECSSP